MDAGHLSRLHALCFANERTWSAQEFSQLLNDAAVLIESTEHAFAIFRVAGDEAELLSIATAPAHRQTGIARKLFDQGLARAIGLGARTVFLEVAAANAPAISAYVSWGFVQVGLRKSYYLRHDGSREDALVFKRAL